MFLLQDVVSPFLFYISFLPYASETLEVDVGFTLNPDIFILES